MTKLTQEQLNEILQKNPNADVSLDSGEYYVPVKGTATPTFRISGTADVEIKAYDSSQPRVVAYDSSQPRVVAYDSSQPRVVASGSSQPRVVASGSSQPRVEAYGFCQPRVEAYGFCQPRVEAYDSSQPRVEAYGFCQLSMKGKVGATCSNTVSVLIEGDEPQCEGGQQIRKSVTDAQAWCENYGVKIEKGVAILFKAVDDDYSTDHGRYHGVSYKPGTKPAAPDWDGGKEECGGGLHFAPRPLLARAFNCGATRYIACPVKVSEIVVHPKPMHPHKVKAPRCYKAVWEVDDFGDPIETPAPAAEVVKAPA